ncbi:MAG TPA: chemotaxis response regulator protein-glutamate methylesterase [Symbiobacteriaceae bacterium]
MAKAVNSGAGTLRVLVVDDSAFMRRIITDLLQSDEGIEVVGTARDGLEAVEKNLSLQPDVITLDVEMPRLDGYGALREIMARRPTPVVMVSSLTREGAQATIRALALGAVDFVTKPSGTISLDMHLVRDELVAKVKAAARATPRYRRVLGDLPARKQGLKPFRPQARGTPEEMPRQVVVIGCSTGGPSALHEIVPRLPADLPAGVLVVQHMPAGFTRSLARRLDEISGIAVKEAEEGDPVTAGMVLVAPGGYHMTVDNRGRIRLDQGPPLHGVRPAVDRTLSSVVSVWKDRTIGVILTGMGYDGARGCRELKQAGGRTIAEDATTCVVYGMPRVVVEMGLADMVLPVHHIAAALVRLVREG